MRQNALDRAAAVAVRAELVAAQQPGDIELCKDRLRDPPQGRDELERPEGEDPARQVELDPIPALLHYPVRHEGRRQALLSLPRSRSDYSLGAVVRQGDSARGILLDRASPGTIRSPGAGEYDVDAPSPAWLAKHARARPHHRELLGELSRAAYETVKELMSAAGEEKGFRPGVVSMVQTFGDQANYHPHVHALATRGGWTRSGEWIPVPYVDEGAAEELFRHKVLALLRGRGLLSEERIDLLLSWGTTQPRLRSLSRLCRSAQR